MCKPNMSDPMGMIGQLFMIGISGSSLSLDERSFIRDEKVGFVILFSRNFSSAYQLRELTSVIHRLTTPPPLIYIDQEGGPIVRLGESGSTIVSHMALAATAIKKNARKAGKIIGREMRSLGIDGVFAPVLDVNSKPENPVIGIRAFSDDPSMVAEYGTEFFRGLKKGRVLGCGKHFPGHGHTEADSHLEIPISETDNSFLSEVNLPPFQKLIKEGISSLMTAHVKFPLISDNPATFSSEITNKLLRESMNFRGVLFSDCIEMNAIRDNFSPEEIIEGFITSSLDVISVSHSLSLQKELIRMMRSKYKNGHIDNIRLYKSLNRIANLKKSVKKRGVFEIFSRKKLRKWINIEKKIAGNSITVLKNGSGLIPLDYNNKILIIDQRKISHSANTNNKDNSILGIIGDRYFSECKLLIPENNLKITKAEKREILEYDQIIIFDHSWCNIPDGSLARTILRLRNDSIIICANSPYIAEHFKSSETIVLTYGSRNIQIEALFSVLTGKAKMKGKLPVTISDTFASGSGIH